MRGDDWKSSSLTFNSHITNFFGGDAAVAGCHTLNFHAKSLCRLWQRVSLVVLANLMGVRGGMFVSVYEAFATE